MAKNRRELLDRERKKLLEAFERDDYKKEFEQTELYFNNVHEKIINAVNLWRSQDIELTTLVSHQKCRKYLEYAIYLYYKDLGKMITLKEINDLIVISKMYDRTYVELINVLQDSNVVMPALKQNGIDFNAKYISEPLIIKE